MGVIAKGIPRGCQGLFTPVSLGYPLSVFNKNSTLKRCNHSCSLEVIGPKKNRSKSVETENSADCKTADI